MEKVSSLRFQVSGFKFQVSGFKFQVEGFRFQVEGFRSESGFRVEMVFVIMKKCLLEAIDIGRVM